MEEAFQIVSRAEADANRKLAEAMANRDAFLAWLRERNTLPASDEDALKREGERRRLAGENAATVDRELTVKRQQLLAGRKWLTEFRLSLAAATSALAGRDKIIVDADQVPGRRTIFLFDPELFKPPLPAKPPE